MELHEALAIIFADRLEKAWSTDLAKKVNGRWVTMNGQPVLIGSDGNVHAGPEKVINAINSKGKSKDLPEIKKQRENPAKKDDFDYSEYSGGKKLDYTNRTLSKQVKIGEKAAKEVFSNASNKKNKNIKHFESLNTIIVSKGKGQVYIKKTDSGLDIEWSMLPEYQLYDILKDLNIPTSDFTFDHERMQSMREEHEGEKNAAQNLKNKEAKEAQDAMESVGVKFGDTVSYDYVSPFFEVTNYKGTLVEKDGIPYVKFKEQVYTSSGPKKMIRWHKGFKKA